MTTISLPEGSSPMRADLESPAEASRDTPSSLTPSPEQRVADPTPYDHATNDPRWLRPALVALLGATALLYLWGLARSGWANSFYSAAAQAGSVNWKAWFFGSSDAANAITVDKPPVALWVMGLSARVFGVNAWSILVPQALAGVASVGLLFATVKRWFGPVAGLIAGAVLATTPVATLMFRFNNPDAMLMLLLIGATYALVRALETTSTRWLVACWSLVGFAFLTKMLQALMVAPAFALVYLICADTRLRRRFVQSIAGFVALIASAGWYVAIVELWPKTSRPYIGGSQHNSMVELILGYNGFGRLTGNETGSANNGGQWGATGWNRLFNSDFGSQASWLIPAALVLLVAGFIFTFRAPRTDRKRMAFIIWGGWLLVTGAAFSFGKGIIHPYYTVALAPAIGALVGMGGVMAWERRSSILGRIVLAATIAVTAWWSHTLLSRSTWMPWLSQAVLIVGLGAAAMLLCAPNLRTKAGAVIATIGLVVGLAGPAAYSVQTASQPHSGALPSAGPNQGSGFGPGGGRGRFGGPGFGRRNPFMLPGSQNSTSNRMAGQLPPRGFGGFGGVPGGFAGGFAGVRGSGRSANAGGLLTGSQSSAKITALLVTSGKTHRWAAAAIGSNSAAGFQLASGKPVMAIGGFNGSDPSPTLAQFKKYVANGDIGWFIASGGGFGGGMGGPPGMRGGTTSTSGAISAWVKANFTATTINGVTLYKLSTK